MKKIRVLFYGLSSHLGGIETYLKKIVPLIDKDKYEMSFLIIGEKKPCYYNDFVNMGCGFYKIVSRKENYIKNIIELRKLFEIEKFDIVHCHQNSLSYITPVLIALKYGSKVIVHSHNAGLIAEIDVKIRHQLNYYRLLGKDIKRVAVSDFAGEWMFGKRTDFTVINNGVEIEKFRFSTEKRERIRREYGILDKEVLIHIGAFRLQKNHVFLIKVFAEYSLSNSDAILMLVGVGELESKVRRMVSDYYLAEKVIFCGQQNDIAAMLSAADKFLFPSLYEGFPNALIEAECSGLPCVVSDVITKQVCIEKFCRRVSLDAPITEWVKALDEKRNIKREKSMEYIMNAGLDTRSEVNKISRIYEDLIHV